MPTSDELSWAQFDKFVLCGVPHAIDIAYDLARSALTIPVSPNFDVTTADLIFYSPVHYAYRRGILSRFLGVLETVRDDANWECLRTCRSAQHTLIETFAETSSRNDRECLDLLYSWMELQYKSKHALERSAMKLPIKVQSFTKAA
jgi:hypothetical protein